MRKTKRHCACFWHGTTWVAITLILSSIQILAQAVPNSIYPEWKERSILTLTNAVRMDPVGYRIRYLGDFQILLPQNYPAVNPVYWDTSLSRSSLVHSIDMGTTCGMQHASCDGTETGVRILKYYKRGIRMGENIASGYPTPLAAMNAWLRDDVKSVPAADKSANDGHRKNIMSAGFKEMGSGYFYGPIAYRHFWTQDFGGGKPEEMAIASGSHFEINSGKITFLLNYFASDGTVASQVNLVLGGQNQAMTLQLGTATKGTFAVEIPTPSVCQDYFFSVTDGKNQSLRYPVTGAFRLEGKACPAGIVFRRKENGRKESSRGKGAKDWGQIYSVKDFNILGQQFRVTKPQRLQ